MILLRYFNEEMQHRCGVCDYCRKRNKLDLNDIEFENIMESIRKLLQKEMLSDEELLKQLQVKHDDKALAVINWMLDHEMIFINASNKLELH